MAGENDIDAMVDKWLADTDESPAVDTGTTNTDGQTNDQGTPATTPETAPTTQPAAGTQTPPVQTDKPGQPGGSQVPPANKTQQQVGQPGDLVRDGVVVARAGAERRHYEAATRLSRELETHRQELTATKQQLETFRQAAQMPTQLGLSPDETVLGLQLAASWKKDPVAVVKYLVEQAQAAGHSVEGLGGVADPGAIKAMLAQELAPFRQQAEQQRLAQEANTAAERQINDLTQHYGESALVNAEALGKLIDAARSAGQNLTLEQTYFRFAKWCQDNQYDPHQPIDPQIEARRVQLAGGGGNTRPQQTVPNTPPRPNGRAPSPVGVVPIDTAAQFTGQESSRDIVRAAMREAGLTL